MPQKTGACLRISSTLGIDPEFAFKDGVGQMMMEFGGVCSSSKVVVLLYTSLREMATR